MVIALGPVLLSATLSPVLFGQSAGSSPEQATRSSNSIFGPLRVSGSLRTRFEAWDWFRDSANNSYVYNGSLLRIGLTGDKGTYDWQIELALPILLGLPRDSIAPGAQGQLGFGGTYLAANSGNTNAAIPFLKQGFIRFKGIGTGKHQSLRFGRMELSEGAEIVPPNGTLAALKRDRIAQRLLGNFGFTHVGRSFDGAQYVFDDGKTNLTLFGARPTRGVFQVDGWGELRIHVFYGAITRERAGSRNAAEWRLFGIGYSDYRDATLKTDNRPLSARLLDPSRIHLATAGGHFLQVAETPAGPFDFLVWGALQGGSWGMLAQRSGAVAVEAGWQPAALRKVRPWVRGGFNYGSGDGNPDDRTHGTFFQLLPTPRVYARFPFFNLMNLRDTFGEVIFRPYGNLTLRADVHALRLAHRNDLWYLGGGAFQPWTFGYTGRPSGGTSGLATLYDASVDYGFTPRASVSVYYGRAAGKSVVNNTYPLGTFAHFGFVELTVRF